MQIGIVPHQMDSWFNGDPRPVLDLIRLADDKGIDAVNLPEHILMGAEKLDEYPYAPPEIRPTIFNERTSFFESLVHLGAIAAVTKRIRLSTGVLLSPLRSATLLAKQLATLDRLSGGRVEIGVGVGWQRLEYDAAGIPWEGRFGRMTEIAQACKLLWTRAPASFHGKYVNFDGVYSLPFPVQKDGIPQWFGLAPTDRNIERMAAAADGWAPLNVPMDVVAGTLRKIKSRMAELGRDPARFSLRLHLNPVYRDGRPNLEDTLAALPRLREAGATHADILVAAFCSSPAEYEPFLNAYLAARVRYAKD